MSTLPRYIPTVWSSNAPDRYVQSSYLQGLSEVAALLESMIDEIRTYWTDEHVESDSSEGRSDFADTKEVFVVHGRDGGVKEAVARFLRTLELEPVVLNEQPDQGLTIIEKFEHHASRVGFAIVLFTPDDIGSLQDEDRAPQARARQNVVLELGYFIGRLGRDRTCALLKGGVEIPSDYYGVLYIEMDEAGAWKTHLIRELKEAGFDIDANRMYR